MGNEMRHHKMSFFFFFFFFYSFFILAGAKGDETLSCFVCFVSTSQDESRVSGELCVSEAVLVVVMYVDMREWEKQRLSVNRKNAKHSKVMLERWAMGGICTFFTQSDSRGGARAWCD